MTADLETQDFIAAYDTLSLRLEQIDGMISALMAIYTQQEVGKMHHSASPLSMLNALGGISELVEQARDARNVLTGCQFEPRPLKTVA